MHDPIGDTMTETKRRDKQGDRIPKSAKAPAPAVTNPTSSGKTPPKPLKERLHAAKPWRARGRRK